MRSLRRTFLAVLPFLAGATALRAAPYLRIVQPYENANIPAVHQTFVFGSVLPATATLTINGIPVTPHTNGGFLAMIPLKPGKFLIEAVASDGVSTTTATRTVSVQDTAGTYPADYPKIDVIAPKGKFLLRPGDTIEIAIQGAPGARAYYRIGAVGDFTRLEESMGAIRGIYKTIVTIKPGDRFKSSDVNFVLRRPGLRKLTSKGGAQITVQNGQSPSAIETKEEAVVLTGPDADLGYNLFAPPGVRLDLTGERSDFYRVSYGGNGVGWIKKNSAIELPPGTAVPRSVSRNLRVDTTSDSTLVIIPLQARHLFRVEQFTHPHNLRLTLFGVTADSDRINFKSGESVIKEISWFQPEPTVCTLDVQTKQDHPWGYDVRYEGTNLVLEIRHRPVMSGRAYSLKGLRIAVDAGHSPMSYGTIGPWGNTESSVTIQVARIVRAELLRRGAEVVMTQDGTKELSLSDRTAIAWRERANFFISIHADACAEGQDPRELQGFSVHYYQPQSHEWAQIVHDVYGQKTGLRDQGLWRSNLAVCRMTQMPSILLEQAFLILPEYEELMLTPRHAHNVADSIATSLLQFMASHPK